jgi:hypothetical protein
MLVENRVSDQAKPSTPSMAWKNNVHLGLFMPQKTAIAKT